jgi:outer membrane protein assembly factor BamA
MKLLKPIACVFIITLSALWTFAQTSETETCRGPIYSRNEVSVPARTEHPNFGALHQAFGLDLRARGVFDVVLCRTGQVTDIKAVEVTPVEIREFFVAAVSIMKFKPAEMNWHTVSQRQRMEFQINWPSSKEIEPAVAAGRLVETLEIVGHRRFETREIMELIKTRSGEPYDLAQVQRDFEAILAKGHFDKLTSRVKAEEGVRGGVGIIFDLVELPLIREIKFPNLASIDPGLSLGPHLKSKIDFREGAVFDSLKSKSVIAVLKELLAARGFLNAKVELRVEYLPGNEVKLSFLVTNK